MSVVSSVNNAAANRGVSTAVSLLVDRSGSMYPYADKVSRSVSEFIESQQVFKGKAFFSLMQFDDVSEFVFKNKDIKEVNKNEFHFQPRGGTALSDALVNAIDDMDASLKTFAAKEKPRRVVIGLITDGEDNMSRNSADKVRQMVQAKEAEGWDFFFLGVDPNTQNVASDLGISPKKTAQYLADSVQDGIKLLSDKVKEARSGKKNMEINSEERQFLLGGPAPKKDEL